MKSVELGSTGIEVPVMAYGTYHLLDKLDPRSAFESLGAAFDAGVQMFETADNYSAAEMVIGRAIGEAVLPRDQIVIAGKSGIPASYYEVREGRARSFWTSPDRIRQKVDDGLWQLGIDNFDLYQLHMTGVEPELFAERAEAMTELTEQGTIRAWGVSNIGFEQLGELLEICDEHGLERPATIQNLGTILGVAGVDAVNLAINEGMTMLAYAPLYHGALTGQTLGAIRGFLDSRDEPDNGDISGDDQSRMHTLLDSAVDILSPLQDYAHSRGKTLSQFALAHMAMQPRTVVLNGMTRPKYVKEAVDAAEWEIDQEGEDLLREVLKRDDLGEIRSELLVVMDALKPYYKKL